MSFLLLLFLPVCVEASLVGYWSFDGNADDQSGWNNHGTILGSPSFVSDVPTQLPSGQSLQLTANYQGIEIAEDASLNSASFTLAYWMKNPGQSGGANRLTSRGNHSFETGVTNAGGAVGGTSHGLISYPTSPAAWRSDGHAPVLNQWTHVAYVYNGTTLTVYANGSVVSSSDLTVTRSGTMGIGIRLRDPQQETFIGHIDDVALWNAPLSQSLIQDLAGGHAVLSSWTAAVGGHWSDSANWQDGIVANGAVNTASFNSPVIGDIALDAPRTISNLTFGDANPSTGGNWTLSGAAAITLAGTATVTVHSGGTAEIETVIAGTSGLRKSGAGTLTLSGQNIYGGTTSINGGTLKLGHGSALPSTTILAMSGTAVLDLNGFDLTVSNVSSSVVGNTITDNGTDGGTSTLTIASGSPTTVAALIKDGDSRQVAVALRNSNAMNTPFTTNNPNTFSGGVTLLHGTGSGTRLRVSTLITTVGSPGNIVSSPFGTGAITIGQAPTDKAGILFDGAANNRLVNDIVFNTSLGTDVAGIRLSTTGNIFSGTITANLAPATFNTGIDNTGSVSLTGQVTGAEGLALHGNNGVLTVTLNNAAGTNDYQGNTIIGANMAPGKSTTLRLGAPNQIPNGANAGNLMIHANGTGTGMLDLNTHSEAINGLSGNGLVDTIAGGTPALTVGDNDATSIFDGVIQNTAGMLSLTKTGAGVLTLTGQNTYSGDTLISGGKLLVTGSLANTPVAVQIGATLGGTGSIAGTVTVNSGGTLSPGLSPGVLTLGSLGLATGSTTFMEINGLARGAEYDGVNISTASGLNYGGSLSLDFGNDSWFAPGTVLDLFSFTGTATGAFADVTSTGFYSGEWTWDDTADGFSLESGWQTLLFSHATGDLTIVPEPAAWMLLLCAAACGLLRRRRR